MWRDGIDATTFPDGFMNPRHLPLAFLLLAGCSDPECCAIKPPSFDVSVVDEEGLPVEGGRVTLHHRSPGVAPDTATLGSHGFAEFSPPPGPVRVTVTPPAGYAAADSSRTDTTVVMNDSTGVRLIFVLKHTS
jgi:hypothetical protein